MQPSNINNNVLPQINTFEETVLFDQLVSTGPAIDANAEYRFGIIDRFTPKTSFINQRFVKNSSSTKENGSDSVIFFSPSAKFYPINTRLDTRKNVYIVRFVTKGTVKNPQTGNLHPAFCSQYPIEVLRTIALEDCSQIQVKDGEIQIVRTQKQNSPAHISREVTLQKENDKTPDIDLSELDQLYSANAFVDFLSSNILKQVRFSSLPIEYIEKAIFCAHRLLFPKDIELPALNSFQKDLLVTGDLAKKWKSTGRFDNNLFRMCNDTAYTQNGVSRTNESIFAMLNRACTFGCYDYTNLCNRFSSCENVLTPHIYVIRAFAQSGVVAIDKSVAEFSKFVKKNSLSISLSHSTSPVLFDWLFMVLSVITTYLSDGKLLSQATKTLLISTYLDKGYAEKLSDVILLLQPQESDFEQMFTSFLQNGETWDEDTFAKFIKKFKDQNISMQLFQKAMAFHWENYPNGKISAHYALMLSWTIKHIDYFSVDEIINCSITERLKTFAKKQALLASFPMVCQMVSDNISCYLLACYIERYIYREMPRETVPEEVHSYLAGWSVFSESFFERMMQDHSVLSLDAYVNLTKYFYVFSLDIPHLSVVHNQYADLYMQQLPETGFSQEVFIEKLNEAKDLGASETYIRLFNKAADFDMPICSDLEYVVYYTEMLCSLNRYTTLFSYLNKSKHISETQRKNLLTKAICRNFQENALSAKSYIVFNEHFSCNDAIALLLEDLKSNQYNALNALLALYCHTQEYNKVQYIYAIFHSRIEPGFSRLHNQVKAKINKFVAKLNDRYSAIDLAIESLPAEELPEFLSWIDRIPLPADAKKGYHPLMYCFDNLLRAPERKNSWEECRKTLATNEERNPWRLAVCEWVLRQKFDFDAVQYSKSAIEQELESFKHSKKINKRLPYNFLPCTFNYIMDTYDTDMVVILADFLQTKALHKMIYDNLWQEKYNTYFEEFGAFCFQQYIDTENAAYYNLMELLGVSFTITDAYTIAQKTRNRALLIRKLCQSYLAGSNSTEIVHILTNARLDNLSLSDSEALKILRWLYTDNSLLLEKPELFVNESSVSRVKEDCARILAAYPEKKELFFFDVNCKNTYHKLIVYSVVFLALFDEDVHNAYHLSAQERRDPNLLAAYMAFLDTSYKVQLCYTVTNNHFFIQYRYLKLYILQILQNADHGDDSFIVALMERLGHFDSIYQSHYEPFKNSIKRLCQITSLSKAAKEALLLGLILGDMSDFLAEHSELLLSFSEENKLLLRSIAEQLNYRKLSHSVFFFYKGQIEHGNYKDAIDVLEAISVCANEALRNLESANTKEAVDKFYELVQPEHPEQCIEDIEKIPNALFCQYENVWCPLYFASQHISNIYSRWRQQMLSSSPNPYTPRHERLIQYLARRSEPGVEDVQIFLQALAACKRNNRPKAAELLRNKDICNGIPQPWLEEAKNMYAFAEGSLEVFHSGNAFMYLSGTSRKNRIEYAFTQRLQEKYSIVADETADQAESLYLQFKSAQQDNLEKLQIGLQILMQYKEANDQNRKMENIPPYKTVVLEVGIVALGLCDELSAEEQFAVAAELFARREQYQKHLYPVQIKLIEKSFGDLLRQKIPLATWVTYAVIVKEYALEFCEDLESNVLQDIILTPCKDAMDPECSLYERYNTLTACWSAAKVEPRLNSPFTQLILNAIDDELKRLEEGIRLQIKIDGENEETGELPAITDGHVYFQIQNVGVRTVTLNDPNIHVLFEEQDLLAEKLSVQNVPELRRDAITGLRVKLKAHHIDKVLSVTLKIVYETDGGHVLLSKRSAILHCAACGSQLQLANDFALYDTSNAVRQKRLLKGRTTETTKLTVAIPRGVTVIYGPSRIGKTSLLNWVLLKAKQNGQVLPISFASELDGKKQSEWDTNFATGEKDIPYHDSAKMSKYLLCDTISFGLKERYWGPDVKPQALIDEIQNILAKDNSSLLDRYYALDRLLQENQMEIWILLDEFQRVVEKWQEIEHGTDFETIIKRLSAPRKLEDDEIGVKPICNIKLIVCGSDDLLREMVLERESVWTGIFSGATKIGVDPLSEDPFKEMIEEDPALKDTNIQYTPAALKALYKYTGGIALYGKEICNAILRHISNTPDEYSGRNTLYVSDVARATQQLLKIQSDEIKTEEQQTISEIYKAVTLNLEDGTMNYLWYIARWLENHPECDSFDRKNLDSKELQAMDISLSDALEIAKARGIICTTQNNENSYIFRTLFYYFAFIGCAPPLKDLEKRIFVEETTLAAEKRKSDEQKMRELFKEIKPDDKAGALCGLIGSIPSEDTETIKRVKQAVGDYVAGNKIEQQTNIQINAQTINTAFNTLLHPELSSTEGVQGYLDAFNKLPSLANVVNTELLVEKSEEERAEIVESQVMGGAVSGALLLRDFKDLKIEEKAKLLRIEHDDCQSIFDELDAVVGPFSGPLTFAFMLHSIFDSIYQNALSSSKDEESQEKAKEMEEKAKTMDFCPVALLYCKLVESILKEKHTSLYFYRLPDATYNGKNETFKLLGRDGVFNPNLEALSYVTIGSFSSHIVHTQDKIFKVENAQQVYAPQLYKYRKTITENGSKHTVEVDLELNRRQLMGERYSPELAEEWERHAFALGIIRGLRNRSAHDLMPITKEQFDWLVDVLFKDRELVRIFNLAKDQTNLEAVVD